MTIITTREQRRQLARDNAKMPRHLVLLCTNGGIVFVGKMNKHLQLWVDDEGRERFRTVSYWMPLPAAPKEPT